MLSYFVRIGAWGEVARCRSVDGTAYRRGARVICRTTRGLEIGQVTAECDGAVGTSDVSRQGAGEAEWDGTHGSSGTSGGGAVSGGGFATIVRATTVEDELLLSRLEKHRCEAIEECRRCLAEAGSQATLLEVDQVFDAGTLVFYFLNPPDQADTELVHALAARYESRVRSGHFAKLLAQGCGPGCGERSCGSDTDGRGDSAAVSGDGKTSRAAAGRRGGCSGSCAVCVVAKSRR